MPTTPASPARFTSPASPDAAAAGILTVGLGNALMGDDGCGEAVVRLLWRRPAPAGFRAELCGTDVLRLLSLWRGEEEVWLVDALLGGRRPGTIRRLDHAQLLALPQRHESVHALSLPECLRWLALTDDRLRRARFRLWGIEPCSLARGPLSPPVAEAASRVSGEIRALAARSSRNRRSPRRVESN